MLLLRAANWRNLVGIVSYYATVSDKAIEEHCLCNFKYEMSTCVCDFKNSIFSKRDRQWYAGWPPQRGREEGCSFYYKRMRTFGGWDTLWRGFMLKSMLSFWKGSKWRNRRPAIRNSSLLRLPFISSTAPLSNVWILKTRTHVLISYSTLHK